MNMISPKQAVLIVASMNVVLFILYANTIKQLFEFWSESYAYSHGVLLFPIALGVYFYELYKKPKFNSVYLNIYTIVSFLGLIFIWFVADTLNIQVVEFFSFFLLLLLINFVLTSASVKQVQHLWPLLLIVFALPLWDFFPEILRTIETPIAVWGLKLSFIDTFQDGFYIYVPAGTFLVETSCSGFNQFLVSVPLAVLYLYSRNLKILANYKFIAVMLLLAMVFNTLRIYIIVVSGQITHMRTHLLEDHEYLAWLIYGIGIFLYFLYTDRKLARQGKLNSSSILSSDNITSVPTLSIIDIRKSLLVLIIILMIGTLLTALYSNFKNKIPLNTPALMNDLHWKEVSIRQGFIPDFVKGNTVFNSALSNISGQSVVLYINYFSEQEQGREAINGLNQLVDKKKGKVVHQTQHTINLSEQFSFKVNESIVQLNSGQKYITWQWYFTNALHTGDAVEARYNNVKAVLKNTPQISNVVVSKRLLMNKEQTREILKLFMSDNFGVLTRHLGGG